MIIHAHDPLQGLPGRRSEPYFAAGLLVFLVIGAEVEHFSSARNIDCRIIEVIGVPQHPRKRVVTQLPLEVQAGIVDFLISTERIPVIAAVNSLMHSLEGHVLSSSAPEIKDRVLASVIKGHVAKGPSQGVVLGNPRFISTRCTRIAR